MGCTIRVAQLEHEELKRVMEKIKGEGIQQWGVMLMMETFVYQIWRKNQHIFINKYYTSMAIVRLIWNDVRIKLGP